MLDRPQHLKLFLFDSGDSLFRVGNAVAFRFIAKSAEKNQEGEIN